MRAELGISESGLARLIGAAFELLELIVFFTAGRGQGGDGAQPAPRLDRLGGGREDPQRDPAGFVRAEVVGWKDLVEAGGYVAARDRGCCAPRGAATSSPTAT